MTLSPRERRLAADARSISQLLRDSSILKADGRGNPPTQYRLRFHGAGLAVDARGNVYRQDLHEIHVELGAAYPRLMPTLSWKTPIFHPNISGGGVVCLGGYGTHWVPSLTLAELCTMLWDMIRYRNFDVNSPYNREAALWIRDQQNISLPVDTRPLRNLVQEHGRKIIESGIEIVTGGPRVSDDRNHSGHSDDGIVFVSNNPGP